jgi:anti-sigma-K factor RskA
MKHTQLTDDLQEQASLYAAGAMTESEREQYSRHLEEDGCAVCRSEVTELQSSISLLAFSLPSSSPSPSVKARLMQQAQSARPAMLRPQTRLRWFDWITAAVAVASIAIAFVVTRTNVELRRTTAQLNSRVTELEGELAEERRNLVALTRPSVRVVELAGQGSNMQARGKMYWDQESKRTIFYVYDLPEAPSDKTYQLWFVTKAGEKVSADVFNTDANGGYRVEIPVPDASTLAAAAVTTEPLGGSPQPTGGFALLGMM